MDEEKRVIDGLSYSTFLTAAQDDDGMWVASYIVVQQHYFGDKDEPVEKRIGCKSSSNDLIQALDTVKNAVSKYLEEVNYNLFSVEDQTLGDLAF